MDTETNSEKKVKHNYFLSLMSLAMGTYVICANFASYAEFIPYQLVKFDHLISEYLQEYSIAIIPRHLIFIGLGVCLIIASKKVKDNKRIGFILIGIATLVPLVQQIYTFVVLGIPLLRLGWNIVSVGLFWALFIEPVLWIILFVFNEISRYKNGDRVLSVK